MCSEGNKKMEGRKKETKAGSLTPLHTERSRYHYYEISETQT